METAHNHRSKVTFSVTSSNSGWNTFGVHASPSSESNPTRPFGESGRPEAEGGHTQGDSIFSAISAGICRSWNEFEDEFTANPFASHAMVGTVGVTLGALLAEHRLKSQLGNEMLSYLANPETDSMVGRIAGSIGAVMTKFGSSLTR